MAVVVIPSIKCTGFERTSVGTILLSCDFGIVQSQGAAATNLILKSYSPDTGDARLLVKRLQYAFWKGRLFEINQRRPASTSSSPLSSLPSTNKTKTVKVEWAITPKPCWTYKGSGEEKKAWSHFASLVARTDRQLEAMGEIPPARLLTEEGRLAAVVPPTAMPVPLQPPPAPATRGTRS